MIPLRLRVALAYAVASALALTALGAFVYLRVESSLEAQARDGLTAQADALAGVPADRRAPAVAALAGERFGQLYTPDGALLETSPQVRTAVLEPDQLPSPGDERELTIPVRLESEDDVEPAMVLARADAEGALVVGASREDLDDALNGVLTQLLVGGPLVLVLASLVGYVVAGVGLRPIESMRRRAESISAAAPDERLPLPGARDEVRRLATTLNAMLDRLEDGLRRERRFLAEAGHELRTPLALLRVELDLALSRPRSHEELLGALRSTNEEVQRLATLAEELLLLAGSGSPGPAADPVAVDVPALLAEVAARFAAEAERRGRTIEVSAADPVTVTGSRSALDRAVSNLVQNALRHGRGTVELGVEVDDRVDDGVEIRVADEGPATTDEVGAGLGLAIVRAVADQHGGTVEVNPEGPGTTVRLRLPA